MELHYRGAVDLGLICPTRKETTAKEKRCRYIRITEWAYEKGNPVHDNELERAIEQLGIIPSMVVIDQNDMRALYRRQISALDAPTKKPAHSKRPACIEGVVIR